MELLLLSDHAVCDLISNIRYFNSFHRGIKSNFDFQEKCLFLVED